MRTNKIIQSSLKKLDSTIQSKQSEPAGSLGLWINHKWVDTFISYIHVFTYECMYVVVI